MKRKLSINEALEMATLVFSMNTEKVPALALAEKAGILQADELAKDKELEEKFLWEWYAFVHASVSSALSVHGPAVLFVEYLRGTHQILENLGYSEESLAPFVDEALLAYSAPPLEGKEKKCPSIFFQRLFQKNIQDISTQTVALISGAMAMLLCACHDTFEKFEYYAE